MATAERAMAAHARWTSSRTRRSCHLPSGRQRPVCGRASACGQAGRRRGGEPRGPGDQRALASARAGSHRGGSAPGRNLLPGQRRPWPRQHVRPGLSAGHGARRWASAPHQIFQPSREPGAAGMSAPGDLRGPPADRGPSSAAARVPAAGRGQQPVPDRQRCGLGASAANRIAFWGAFRRARLAGVAMLHGRERLLSTRRDRAAWTAWCRRSARPRI